MPVALAVIVTVTTFPCAMKTDWGRMALLKRVVDMFLESQ